MIANGKRRGTAVAALGAMMVAAAASLIPAGSAEAGWRGYGHGYYGGWRPYPYHGYYGYGGYRGYNPGAAVAAGVIGLAAGAAIGSALAQPRYYSYGPGYYGYATPGPVPPATPVYDPSLPAAGGGAYAAGSPSWYSYCAAKYRSFDPRSGTYLGYDGRRHYCR